MMLPNGDRLIGYCYCGWESKTITFFCQSKTATTSGIFCPRLFAYPAFVLHHAP
jgi:hypothetical protein